MVNVAVVLNVSFVDRVKRKEEKMIPTWLRTVMRSVESFLLEYPDADEKRKKEIIRFLKDEYYALPESYQENTSVRDLRDLWWRWAILLKKENDEWDAAHADA
jgi:hypothetical protein